MEPVTALLFTKIRYCSPPIIAANFYWTFTVVRDFSEYVLPINSLNPLNNPHKEILLLHFFRWTNLGMEGWITCPSSHRKSGILNQVTGHQIPQQVPISLCPLLDMPSCCFTCNLCFSQIALFCGSQNTFLFFRFGVRFLSCALSLCPELVILCLVSEGCTPACLSLN